MTSGMALLGAHVGFRNEGVNLNGFMAGTYPPKQVPLLEIAGPMIQVLLTIGFP